MKSSIVQTLDTNKVQHNCENNFYSSLLLTYFITYIIPDYIHYITYITPGIVAILFLILIKVTRQFSLRLDNIQIMLPIYYFTINKWTMTTPDKIYRVQPN